MDNAPEPGTPAPPLLSQDILVMQQVRSFMSNDFEIFDAEERPVGRIQTQGSGAARFLMGSRDLMIAEADGQPLLQVKDTVTLGRDRFELLMPDGAPFGSLVKKFALFRTSVDLQIHGGPTLEMTGDFMGYDFRFLFPNGAVAGSVGREWAGFSRGFLGHSKYMVKIHPEAPVRDRLAMIGGVVALDLIRAKQKQRNS